MNNLGFYGDKIGFCCNSTSGFYSRRPKLPYFYTAEETTMNFLNHKNAIINELKGLAEVNALNACVNCPRMGKNFTLGEDKFNDTEIRHIDLACYPSVCQAKCIYCQEYKKSENTLHNTKQSIYPKIVAEIIHFLRNNNRIANSCIVTVAPAEITITPSKDLLLDAISYYKSRFLTNCFLFDQKIADSLKSKESLVNVSLDSGTRETFKLVKGRDMFCEVIENLKRYRSCGNVEVKYIVLPGVNDDINDYVGIAEILKTLNIDSLIISFDYGLPLRTSLFSIAKLVRILTENGKSFIFHAYYSVEQINDFIEKFITPNTQQTLETKYNLLKDTFNALYKDDYETYKKYIYTLEIKELVECFTPDTRFALLGNSCANEIIQSSFKELHVPLQLNAAPYIEAYKELKDNADIFIIHDKSYFTDTSFLANYTNDERARFLDIERYFFSFEPAKTFVMRNF
jgi:pyruvate-formate lyase-activating enzyme